MASKKPPPVTQPTGPPVEEHHPGSIPVNNMNPPTENSNEIRPADADLPVIPIPRVHPVNFEVTNSGNAVGFLTELLTSLQSVDNSSVLLPHPEANVDSLPCSLISEIPKEAEEKKEFVLQYLHGLRITNNIMKGKFWLLCHANFLTFKKNEKFKNWMSGSKTAPRVQLDRTDLPGTTRHPVGIFVNVIARSDLERNFADRISSSLVASHPTRNVPAFQIEAKPIFIKDSRTRVYRLLASSKEDVTTLKEMMATIMPRPNTDVSFIPYVVWESLPSEKKKAYFDMQQSFAEDYNAMIFRGIKNHLLRLTETRNRSFTLGKTEFYKQRLTILEWIYSQASSDSTRLFYKVYSSASGEIEIWHNRKHEQEARAWLKSALSAIAKLSGIDINSDRVSAEAMFVSPDNVWKNMAANFLGKTLLEERKGYLDFSPPTRSASNPSAVKPTNSRNSKAAIKPRKLQIVFDLDDVASVLSLDHRDAKSATSSKKSRRSKSNKAKKQAALATASTSAPTTDTAAAVPLDANRVEAKKKADKALVVALAALKKAPFGSANLNAGEYYSVLDAYGNSIPIVYLRGIAVPLTEANLLASRSTQPTIRTVPPSPQPTVTPRISAALAAAESPDTTLADSVTAQYAGLDTRHTITTEQQTWADMNESDDDTAPTATSPHIPNSNDYSVHRSMTGFSEVDSKEYRDNTDFDDMTEQSDNTNDNRTVTSLNSTVTWSSKVKAPPTPPAKVPPAHQSAENHVATSLQRAVTAPTSVLRPSSFAAVHAGNTPDPAQVTHASVAAPRLSNANAQMPGKRTEEAALVARIRQGHHLQTMASNARHKAETDCMLETIASFKQQLQAMQQQYSVLASNMSVSASASTISSAGASQFETVRRSTKSSTIQRSPPKNPSVSSTAGKKSRTSTSQNRFSALQGEEDEEEITFTGEEMDLTTDSMSVEETATRVSNLSIQKPPASGSNGAGNTK